MRNVTDPARVYRAFGPLGALLDTTGEDGVFDLAIDSPGSVLSIPEPARAFAVASLAQRLRRRLVVVATPTHSEAERLASDLEVFLGTGTVDVCPAWETLPLERVSPATETMGRRVRTMWHLRSWASQHDAGSPRVVVAPVKSLLQRLGPHVEETAPVVVAKGDTVDLDDLVARLVGLGYRREYQVEHRGEIAVRGSIVDVFGSTADLPVRIDLWGDEVDRLSEFSVGDQRSVSAVERVELFACRELRPTAEIKARAAELVRSAPWGRAQWERLADGAFFDGMESWLAWLSDDEHVLGDLVPDDALVLLVEPRRMRDRALDLAAEEESLVSTLARTWNVDSDRLPRLHLPFDRLLARTQARTLSITSAPEGPDTLTVGASGWDPLGGGGERLVGQLKALQAERYRVAVCADGHASAARLRDLLESHGVAATLDEAPSGFDDDRAHVVAAPLERGFLYRESRIAVVAESDLTGRRRTHRRPRPKARNSETFFDDLHSGSLVVHHQHGVGRFAGMVRRSISGVERDYLLLEYKGGDRLYVPSDQVDLTAGGTTPL